MRQLFYWIKAGPVRDFGDEGSPLTNVQPCSHAKLKMVTKLVGASVLACLNSLSVKIDICGSSKLGCSRRGNRTSPLINESMRNRSLVAKRRDRVRYYRSVPRKRISSPRPVLPARSPGDRDGKPLPVALRQIGTTGNLPLHGDPKSVAYLRPSRSDKRGGRASSRTRGGMRWTRQR